MKSELVMPTHLARKAVVYIRQSTPHQVVSNQESLRLQYALRRRARDLGWHEADIDVIDADLGLSGASAAQRSGFKELVGRVGLSEVGMILSIDVTRRKEVEQALIDSERKFAKIFETSPLAIYISDLQSDRIVESNPAFSRLSGYAQKDALGRTGTELGLWEDPSMRDTLLTRSRNF